jgi:hypothetical protein
MTPTVETVEHDGPVVHREAEVEPLFITLPVASHPVGEGAGETAAGSGPGHGDEERGPVFTGDGPGVVGPARRAPSFSRRHRVALVVTAAIVAVLGSGVWVFAYEWTHSGPRPLSMGTAYQRFRSEDTGSGVALGGLRPHQGVYAYSGTGHEQISLPPKSQVEGPGVPGTVSYQANGCWVWRMDYSDSHWQNATFCDRGGSLVEVGRAGWYRWNLVVLAIADTATFRCTPEVVLPAILRVGQQFPFSCTGTNNPIHTAPVSMKGTNRYVGPQTLRIAGRDVPTVHFREVSSFSGGQRGTNVADTWFSTVNGLPVKGTWSTKVSSPTFLGTSTLTGSASFTLRSLIVRS